MRRKIILQTRLYGDSFEALTTTLFTFCAILTTFWMTVIVAEWFFVLFLRFCWDYRPADSLTAAALVFVLVFFVVGILSGASETSEMFLYPFLYALLARTHITDVESVEYNEILFVCWIFVVKTDWRSETFYGLALYVKTEYFGRASSRNCSTH